MTVTSKTSRKWARNAIFERGFALSTLLYHYNAWSVYCKQHPCMSWRIKSLQSRSGTEGELLCAPRALQSNRKGSAQILLARDRVVRLCQIEADWYRRGWHLSLPSMDPSSYRISSKNPWFSHRTPTPHSLLNMQSSTESADIGQ